jgi:hypothetical protein
LQLFLYLYRKGVRTSEAKIHNYLRKKTRKERRERGREGERERGRDTLFSLSLSLPLSLSLLNRENNLYRAA